MGQNINYPSISDYSDWSLDEVLAKIDILRQDIMIDVALEGKLVEISGRREDYIKPYLGDYKKKGYKIISRLDNYCGEGIIMVTLIRR